MWPLRILSTVALLAAAHAALAQAPIEYRRARPSGETARAPPPPDRAQPAAPNPPRPATAPPPQSTAPPAASPADEPDWAAGPGVPLSVFALRPEEAQPFDPRNPPRHHLVARGETLFSLAARYQVSLRALIDQNRLAAPFALEVGQVLAIPRPRFVEVAAGDSLVAIARRHNIDARSLALLNRLRAPYAVRPGDRLVLPAAARTALAEPARSTPEPPQRAEPAPVAAPPASRPAAGSTAGAAQGGGGPLAWPLRGALHARFGPQTGGRRSDGIEILAAEGARFAAAADGVVVYAGEDLQAYGALVLVRHADGRMTAYGYARALSVREGQQVRRGQALGAVGKIDAGPARLMFQVRRGAQPQDPLPLLART